MIDVTFQNTFTGSKATVSMAEDDLSSFVETGEVCAPIARAIAEAVRDAGVVDQDVEVTVTLKYYFTTGLSIADVEDDVSRIFREHAPDLFGASPEETDVEVEVY